MLRIATIVSLSVSCLAQILFLQPGSALAVPAGRAWAPIETLVVPEFDYLVAPRLETSLDGNPLLIVTAKINGSSSNDDGLGFRWTETAWAPWWRLGADPLVFWPVDAPPGRYPLVYTGGAYNTNESFFVAEVVDDHVTEPEVVAHVDQWRVAYAGAFRNPRRWVAIEDRGVLRLFYSDSRGVWTEVATGGIGNNGVSLVALDDTTAMLAWSGFHGEESVRWGILRGSQWEAAATQLAPSYGNRPRLRANPGGGAWLTWSGYDKTAILRRYVDQTWSAPESLHCAYSTDLFGIYTDVTDMSRDAAPRPVVAWTYSSFLDGSTGLCVCIPNENGWDLGDELRRSGSFGALPTVARDRNGDVWVAWSESFEPFRWTHTYTTATTTAPRVNVATGRPSVSWTLSDRAPSTWWTVLRQKGTGSFEQVARLQAGPGPEMSWTDTDNRPGGVLRDAVSYRVRRESVDRRYEWLSPVATWVPGGRRLHLNVSQPGLSGDALTLELSGATGSQVSLTIYDLAGRVVQRRELQIRGGEESERLKLFFGATRLPAGVYFAQARDESGMTSQGVKFVQLR